MTLRWTRTRWFAVALLLPTLAAMVPSIQWCALNWDQVTAASYVRCMVRGMPGAGSSAVHSPTACSAMTAPANTCPPVCAKAACSPARDEGSRPAHTRAFCLGDPASGRAIRSQAPRMLGPNHVVALLVAAAEFVPVQAPAQAASAETVARSPTRIAATRPPVRAPPSLI